VPAIAQNCSASLVPLVNGTPANASTVWGNFTYLGGCAASTASPLFTGNVGIDTTTPAYSLDVAGFINTNQASGYLQAGSSVLYANLTYFTLAVGAPAAATWMNGSTTAWYSMAIGPGALATTPTMSSAIQNVAIGYDALQDNSTGYDNTALGFEALQDNAGGYQDTAMGDAALQSNTSGYNSTAIGYSALQAATTGYRNTAIGENALANLTTGSSNVALGYEADYHGQTSTNGVMIGAGAGSSSAGYHNAGSTFVGYRAGFAVGTGSDYNLFVGYEAGQDVTTGNHNIVLSEEDATPDGITTGSSNILIGDNLSALSATGSNQLDIGNIIFGTGLSSGGTTISGNIGIGTATPADTLEVNGLVKIDSLGSTTATPVCVNAGVLSSCTSSLRYKENVEDAPFGLNDVMQMRPVTFKWKGRDENDFGLIAEEVAKINPLFATYKDGKVEGVKYMQLTAVLIGAIKQLKKTNDAEALEVTRLRARLDALQSANDAPAAEDRRLSALKSENADLKVHLLDIDQRLDALERENRVHTAARDAVRAVGR
jgi:hypothetical protein